MPLTHFKIFFLMLQPSGSVGHLTFSLYNSAIELNIQMIESPDRLHLSGGELNLKGRDILAHVKCTQRK